MLVDAPGEHPEPDEDEASNEACLHKPERYTSAMPRALPFQKVVLFCPLPGKACHLKWWLAKSFADHLDIFYMYVEMGNNEHTEMQLKFQDSLHPSVIVTKPKVGGTCLNLIAANHSVRTQRLRVWTELCRVFARVVWLRQNSVEHTWLLNTRPGGYDDRASDLHQLPGLVEMRVLHGLMSWPNITMLMAYCTVEGREDHTPSWRSMETSCCQIVRINDNFWGSVIKVRLFKQSTNTISPTEAK